MLLAREAAAQNTFQKTYPYPADVQNFGALETMDGNFLVTGIADIGGQKLFLSKQDCEGTPLWSRTYSASSTVGNISQRVIETTSGHYVMSGSAGTYNAYDIAVVKTDPSGNTLWKKTIAGPGDDVVNAVYETTDQGLVIAGKTNSWGQDAGTSYRDVYLAKLDSGGNFLWGRTYGTAQAYDEAFDVVETPDHNLALTGRYIADGAFHCLLLVTDSIGGLKYIKAYGDTNHNTTGFALINVPGGGFAITGSTTVLKASFQAFPDEFLIKTDANGDTLWTRAWHGSNSDGSENGSSLLMTPDGGFALGVATFSYPTTGFVPNKHMILRADKDGHMLFARTYNNGGSHYPYLARATEGYGYLLSGFSNLYTPDFNPLLIRTDSLFASGCNETNVTPLTFEQQPLLHVKSPAVLTGAGGVAAPFSAESAFALPVNALCQNIVDSCSVPSVVPYPGSSGPAAMRVYPNPASGLFAVRFDCRSRPCAIDGLMIESYDLTDACGRIVISRPLVPPSPTAEIAVHGLSPGTYLLRAHTPSGRLYRERIVLQ